MKTVSVCLYLIFFQVTPVNSSVKAERLVRNLYNVCIDIGKARYVTVRSRDEIVRLMRSLKTMGKTAHPDILRALERSERYSQTLNQR